jgi:hypothetical protein
VPHGGVTSTNFNARSASERAGITPIADYDAFIASTNKAFAGMRAASSMSSDDVARVVYEAATDGTSRLRYLIGDDSRGFIRARREMSDQDYVDFMRSKFPALDAENEAK